MDLSQGAAYSVLYCALIAVAATCLTYSLVKKKLNQRNPDETAISARGTQGWKTITASFFASSLGSWILSGPAETGAYYGWWAVIGYACCTGVPWTFLAFLGTRMRDLFDSGFTSTDFLRIRLGRWAALIIGCFQLLILFLSFLVEIITVGDIYATVAPGTRRWVVALSIALIVFVYSIFGGVHSTFLADKIQAAAAAVLIVVGTTVVFSLTLPHIPSEAVKEAGRVGDRSGVLAGFTLILSTISTVFLDPSAFARIYAAKTSEDARFGILVAAPLVCIPVLLFGAAGIFSQAAVEEGLVDPTAMSGLFGLVTMTVASESARTALKVCLLLLATILSASSTDTMLMGCTCLFAKYVQQRSWNFNVARFATLAVFLLAVLVFFLVEPSSIVNVFMIGNLLASVCAPVLAFSVFPLLTPAAAAGALLLSAVAVTVYGGAHTKSARGAFGVWLLPEDSLGWQGFITIGLALLVSIAGCAALSYLHRWMDPSVGSDVRRRIAVARNLSRGSALSESTIITACPEGHFAAGLDSDLNQNRIDAASGSDNGSDITDVTRATKQFGDLESISGSQKL